MGDTVRNVALARLSATHRYRGHQPRHLVCLGLFLRKLFPPPLLFRRALGRNVLAQLWTQQYLRAR
jgi:hypothetical protein